MNFQLTESLKKLIKDKTNSILKKILKLKNLAKIRDDKKRSVLHYAAMYNNLDITKMAIDAKCNPNSRDVNGNTPLFLAAVHNNYQIINFLLTTSDANLFHCSTHGHSILDMIFSTKHEIPRSVIKNVLKKVKDTYPSSQDMANVLIKAQFPFWHFSAVEDAEVISILVQNIVDLNEADSNGQTVVHHLADVSYQNTIEFLRNKVIEVNKRDQFGRTALQYALTQDICNYKYAQFLLDKGGSMGNDQEVFELFEAILLAKVILPSHRACMEILLQYGANPLVLDKNDKSIFDLVLPRIRERSVRLVMEPVIAHIALLAANEDTVPDYIVKITEKHRILKNYYSSCCKLIQIMQKCEVASGITYYQMLVESENKIKKYVRLNKKMQTSMTLTTYYQFRLKNRIVKAKRMNALAKVAMNNIMENIPFLKGEHLIANEIVSYLTYADMLLFS